MNKKQKDNYIETLEECISEFISYTGNKTKREFGILGVDNAIICFILMYHPHYMTLADAKQLADGKTFEEIRRATDND